MFKLDVKSMFFFVIIIIMIQQLSLNCLLADDNPVPNQEIMIIVNETSLIQKPRILLGDISKVHAGGFLKEALEKIDLGPSPRPDKIKSFDKKKIVSAIQGQRYLPENIMITSPRRIYVKRLSQMISEQDIRQFVDQHLSQLFKGREYQVKTFSVRGLEPCPQGEVSFQLDSDELVDRNGKLSFFLDLVIDGEKENRLNVQGTVGVYETVLLMKKSLKKGETISREDIVLEKKNIFDLDDNVIKTLEKIDKKILKSDVRKGDYLTSSLLADPPLVQKGEIIQLIARNEGLLIVTHGISKEDGYIDGLINVENMNSGKLVRGIVKGKSKVEVVY